MYPESHGFVAMPVTICIKNTCSNLSHLIIVTDDEIVCACDRHSNETVTLRTHVTKYKNLRKRMVKFIRNSENRGDKIVRVNSIRISKSVNLH